MLSDVNVSVIKEKFRDKAAYYDKSKNFPYENFELIVKENMHTINLSSEFGGVNLGIEDTCDLIIELAQGCPSTALCLAMHYYSLGAFKKIMSDEMKNLIFKDLWTGGHFFTSINQPNILLNSLTNSSENITPIKAKKVSNGYIVSGMMSYVSGCLRAKYIPTYCLVKSENDVNNNISMLLLKTDDVGISIEDTWDFSGMRASKSNKVILSNVFVPFDRLIGREGYGIEDSQLLFFWFNLLLASVYYGIAKSAYLHIIDITKSKVDPISKKLISLLPGTQFRIADIKVLLDVAYSQLKNAAKSIEGLGVDNYNQVYITTLVTKLFISNNTNKILEECIKIEGMSSLKEGSLLERLNRDVKALLFHSPQEDLAKEVIGKKTMGIIPVRNRWL